MHISIIPPKGKEIVVPKTSECLMIHGRDLLYYMYQELDIVAYKDYFGLTYCGGKDGKLRWLEEDDQMRKLEQSLGRKMTFQVAASCHPEEPEETFDCRPSRRLFRDLIKEKLLKGQLGCEVELHAELDAIILQTEQGDYSSDYSSYEEALLNLDICSPTYLSCGKSPSEAYYLKLVKQYHKKLAGVSKKDGERMYLSRLRDIPFYPYKVYQTVELNGGNVSVGLRQKGLCVLEYGTCERFVAPKITNEYLWSDLRYCTHSKHKVRLGVFSGAQMEELTLKIKGPRGVDEGKCLFKDITKYRDIYLAKKCENVGKAERAAILMLGGANSGPDRKISAFTESIENSFRMLRQRAKNQPLRESLE